MPVKNVHAGIQARWWQIIRYTPRYCNMAIEDWNKLVDALECADRAIHPFLRGSQTWAYAPGDVVEDIASLLAHYGNGDVLAWADLQLGSDKLVHPMDLGLEEIRWRAA